MPMFIIQGLLNTPSLVLYGSKNSLKTCERFELIDPRIPMGGARLTALLPFYRMRRLQKKLCIGLTEIFGVFFFSDKYIDTITGRKYDNTASIKKENESRCC